MKNKKTASITVFMSLMLMVIASLLFTLLEGSRYLILDMISQLNSQVVTESVFAEYHVPAYTNYHLLMMDSGYGTNQLLLSSIHERMQKLGQENLNPTVTGFGKYSNFLQMDVTDSSVVHYELITDQETNVLLKQMIEAIKSDLGISIADQVVDRVTDVTESWEQGKEADKYFDGALDTLERAKEDAENQQSEGGEQETKHFTQHQIKAMPLKAQQAEQQCSMPDRYLQVHQIEVLGKQMTFEMDTGEGTEVENPMEDIKSAKGSPLLAQILSEGKRISSKVIEKEDAVERRTLNVGNYEKEYTIHATDKAFILQYLKKYTSHYLKKIEIPHALSYEQEYILFGKYSDEENLKKMASRILFIREGINFAYLLSDSAKQEEAFVLATAIAAAAGIPFAVKAIQMGILASWAYAESIVELRSLFSNEKIAAVKTAESWTVNLAEAGIVIFQNSVKAKPVNNGIDYQDYLDAFMLLEDKTKIGKRFANLLEKNIRLYAGYEQARIDCMVTAMETKNTYHAKQAFLTFVTVGGLSKAGYDFENLYEFSYLDQ